MSALLKTALCAALVITVASSFAGDKSRAEGSRPRALTHAEGKALAEFAEHHRPVNQRPDCSHLVHELFAGAGLEYPYAPSTAIFAGLPQFQRVSSPQPGDLIVWPGHVGLVIDPHHHTFLSSTRTGIRTKDYTTAYWRTRGSPRLYRYVVSDASERIHLAQLMHRAKR
jgi:cell wall-associated NlpC family hydrolase